MKTYYECIPCFVNQTLRMISSKESPHHEKVLREVLFTLSEADFSNSPPELTKKVFDVFEKHHGFYDHYSDIKKHSNSYVMSMYDELISTVNSSPNPFDVAARLAIAGNVIDFGANHVFKNEYIHQNIKDALAAENIDLTELKDEVFKAKKILYLGDNAGEIVFDKLFINQLPREKVKFVVRGGAILNDALMEDAIDIGLTQIVEVISNGASLPGTVLKYCSKEFLEVFDKADLIISKGQGNYETLSEQKDKNIFFLLKAKCPVIARDLNCNINDYVILKNQDKSPLKD
ncbi:MAG TPA: hypothetical protein DD381_05370 [Lentisphaeria bacterium]|nr:MAG: hypothetical protein A2X47_01550 [Lentisphaerae bacterium GWF2_38_69]HBM15760.1 hypothetical protein [Lentisphaeria bacterium]